MDWQKQLKFATWQRRIKHWCPDAWRAFAALLLIALNLTLVFRIHLPVPFWLSGIGMLVVPLALAIIFGGQLMISSAKENGRGLVTRGIHHHSRHPMYLGFVLLFIGVGLGQDLVWFVAVGLATPFVFDRFVLPIEDRETARIFGKAWKTYAATTPPWL